LETTQRYPLSPFHARRNAFCHRHGGQVVLAGGSSGMIEASAWQPSLQVPGLHSPHR
jgi:hypothetical protein